MSTAPPNVADRRAIVGLGPRWIMLVALLLLLPIITALLGMWLYSQQFGGPLSDDHHRWGEFGDFIGGIVGTVLAAATLIALAITLLLQARALKDARQALDNQQQSAQEQLKAAQSLFTAAKEANDLTNAAMQQTLALERARNRPHVIFDIDFVIEQRRHQSNTHAYARVRNIGATSAHNVLITTSPVLRGRLGIGTEPRQPTVVGTTIAFMPPKHEVKDLLAYAPFLFEDNADEQLRFSVHLTYTDSSGELYEENYAIDLAALKGTLISEDISQMNLIKVGEQMERAARALDTIARVLDSPDRSTFMRPMVGEIRLSQTQQALLRELIALGKKIDPPSFMASLHVGDHRALIKPLGEGGRALDAQQELRGQLEDLEYLCRTGALHGCYRHGILMFSLTASAERVLRETRDRKQEGDVGSKPS
jgi:hypothetical protein